MLVHRKLVMATGVAVAVAGLTGCQQKLVTAVSVSGNGSVTISETSAVVYDQSAGNLKVVKPDPAALLAAAKKDTKGYVGPGVSKPTITLTRAGKHELVLTIAQTMASIALLDKHGDALGAATLSLDVEPVAGQQPDPNDPLGAKGPRTEKVIVDGGSGDAGADPRTTSNDDNLVLKHVGHLWTFSITESAKEFAEARKSEAELAKSFAQAGISPKVLVLELHVKLPGSIVSTNGKRLGGGVVSWDALHPTSRVLSLTTKS